MTRNEFPINVTEGGVTQWELVQGWTGRCYGVSRSYKAPGWAVTHLASGSAIASKLSSAKAAKWLAEEVEKEYPNSDEVPSAESIKSHWPAIRELIRRCERNEVKGGWGATARQSGERAL